MSKSKSGKRSKEKDSDDKIGVKKIKIETPDVKLIPFSGSRTLDWEIDDLSTLINNLGKCLPKNDVAKYSTLIEKLDWEKVRFGRYSAMECKDKWIQVMSRLRRYRTLTDMVTDARVWLKAPWQTYNNSKKIKHPDFPKKPLTPFFRYFMEKREKMGKGNPGASVTDLAKMLSTKFGQLNEKKKLRYKEAYDREYELYKQKLEKFKKDHPEIEFGTMTKQQFLHTTHEGPHKPRTPYQLFTDEKMKKGVMSNDEKKEQIEKVKKAWAELSEGKRIKWIRKSLADQDRYDNEVIEYTKEHPNFEPNKLKSVLSKNEKELKDKFDGKPERPPNSGYSLFSKILLRELKNVPSKEKMVVIAKRWKELSDTERSGYNREAQKSMSKYVEKFETYLNQLPEAERTKVLSENKLKLPTEKKLSEQKDLPKVKIQTIPVPSVSIIGENAKEHAAMMAYQMERIANLQGKYPNKGKSDILKITIQEWNEKLSEKRKVKYYKLADSVTQIMPSKPQLTLPSPSDANNKQFKGKKPISAQTTALLKREPKRPPKTGYALFTSEQLSSMTDIEPKKRMTEIARIWKNEINKSTKENYDQRSKSSQLKHLRDLEAFKATLTKEELQQYQTIINEKNKSKGGAKGKSKANDDPVVDDSNVIETIDVATSANNELESDNDDDDDDDDDEDEDDDDDEEEDDVEEDNDNDNNAGDESGSDDSESESEDDESEDDN